MKVTYITYPVDHRSRRGRPSDLTPEPVDDRRPGVGHSMRGGRHDGAHPSCARQRGVPIYALGDWEPTIDPTAYVHPDAVVIGDVELAAEASVWPAAVLRGDYGSIRIGPRTSIQDGTVVHATARAPAVIGAGCVVGHNAHLEGCIVEDDCLIGSMSVVLQRAIVRSGALVGAHALVGNGVEVPSRAMALGVPARMREDAVAEGAFARTASLYVANARRFATELRRIG